MVWLGGTDEFEEGKWTWDNGEPFKFKHWGDEQPAGSNGFNFLILDGKSGKWADTTDFSGKVKGYVCEWKGSAPKECRSQRQRLKAPAINNFIQCNKKPGTLPGFFSARAVVISLDPFQ